MGIHYTTACGKCLIFIASLYHCPLEICRNCQIRKCRLHAQAPGGGGTCRNATQLVTSVFVNVLVKRLTVCCLTPMMSVCHEGFIQCPRDVKRSVVVVSCMPSSRTLLQPSRFPAVLPEWMETGDKCTFVTRKVDSNLQLGLFSLDFCPFPFVRCQKYSCILIISCLYHFALQLVIRNSLFLVQFS